MSLLFAMPLSAAANDLNVVYEKSGDKAFFQYAERLRQDDALPAMLEFVNQHIPLAQPLTLRIGAEEGPLFDPALNEIWVPGSFLREIENRFVDAEIVKTPNEGSDVMLDVFFHTLLHEVAHAIVAQFNIPSLGKEEDAADNLANVLLLEYANEGDIVTLNAADMFALEDQDADELHQDDFWDEHSLDIQRYYTTVCHVFGAYPEDNEEMIEHGELSAEKAERCIDEYAQIRHDWLRVLAELDPDR